MMSSMTIDALPAAEFAAPVRPLVTPAAASGAARAAARLQQCFGVEFTILDGDTGDVLYQASDQPCCDWAARGEVCREVARRGAVEFIEEDFPLILLAVALPEPTPLVGLAAFATRALETEREISLAARFLRCELDDAREWAHRQTPLSPAVLQRLATMALDRMAAERRIETLEAQAEQLSQHVAFTYEEISLLHRLTQNLRINAKEAELGKVALEWLGEIMPFEGLALQLLASTGEQQQGEQGNDSKLITYGNCPLDNAEFARLVQGVGVNLNGRPAVINRTAKSGGSWEFPQVRQLILLPIGENRHLFGYLAAINHSSDCEFGTPEADLLGSVAAILGIHSGNAELYRQQAELLSGIVRALTSAIDAKDPYTCGHSDRVARVSVRLARELGCNQETVELIYLAGLLHDVGKIGIDDGVLRKPGKLTEAEFLHIQTHVRIGHNILVDLKQLDKVLPVVLHHHEAWDGSGYPDGLAGEQIPLLARIVAVADAFDAMKSDRPYRQGMDDEKLDAIIRSGAGKQWDARVVAAFFRAREHIRHISQHEMCDESFELPHYL